MFMLKDLLLILLLLVILAILIFVSVKQYKKNTKEITLKKKIICFLPPIIYVIIILIILIFNGFNKMSYVEQQVFDRTIDFIENNDFFNPKDARLMEVIVEYKYNEYDREYTDTIEDIYFKISGTNKVGGTINSCYRNYLRNYSWENWEEDCEDIYKSGLGYEELSNKSIKKINTSLKKHWKDLGL